MEVLSGGCWLAVEDSANDGFVEVSAFVMNSSPTSINSSRFDELLEVMFDSDENDFIGFNGGVDTSTDNNTDSYYKSTTIQELLLTTTTGWAKSNGAPFHF